MDTKIVAAVIVVCVCVVGIEAGGGSTSGKFEWDGRQCEYSELGQRGSHDRTLRVGCKGNKKKKIPQLSCLYDGDPHPCHWYNQNNQGSFYRCLVNGLIANGGNNLCSPNSVSCHNHCQEIVFAKRTNILRELVAEMEEIVNTSEEDALNDDSDYYEY